MPSRRPALGRSFALALLRRHPSFASGRFRRAARRLRSRRRGWVKTFYFRHVGLLARGLRAGPFIPLLPPKGKSHAALGRRRSDRHTSTHSYTRSEEHTSELQSP